MTTIVAIFLMLVLSVLCLMLASTIATGSETARSVLRAKQSFYLSDAANQIGKQLVADNGTAWRPWTGSAYSCPSGWTGGANDANTHYCQGTMTVDNRTATIRVYICDAGSTTGDNNDPCMDAPAGGAIDVLGIGFLSGA